MVYLFVVSLIWAFSFGLIKENFTGIDASLIACLRLFISLITFLPLFRPRKIKWKAAIRLFIAGVFQFGLMYIFYFIAFQYLQAYEVALFTIFTPLYVTLINDVMKKRFHAMNLFTTSLAITGTAVVKQAGLLDQGIILGFFYVQLSNVCFAFGQIYYREIMKNKDNIKDENIFAYLYLGGFLITALSASIFTDWHTVSLSGIQIVTLLYLGAVASGLCFFLWNYGGRQVNTGALAIFNNLKVPLAVTVSLVFFHEKTDLPSLLIGGSIVLIALLLNEYIHNRMENKSIKQPA